MSQQNHHIYAFGPFRFDPRERLLLRDNRPVPLTPKVADTLEILLQNPGRLVDKDELMRRVWPDTVVEEGNLNKNIFVLRKALGKFEGGDYIETVSKRGYRFLPPVSVSMAQGNGHSPASGSPAAEPAPPVGLDLVTGEVPQKSRELRYQGDAEIRTGLEHLAGSNAKRPLRTWAALTAAALVLLIVTAAYFWKRTPRFVSVAPEITLRQLTRNSADNPVAASSISPDGKTLAFLDNKGIHLKTIDTEETRLIVPATDATSGGKIGWDLGPWFPDGRAFLAHAFPLDHAGFNNSVDTSVWLVPTIAGSARLLREHAIAWDISPDGATISFGANPGKFGEREAWMMDSNGEHPRKVYENNQGAVCCFGWFKDQPQFSYYVLIDASGPTLFSRAVTGGAPVPLLGPAESKRINDFVWLREGRLLLSQAESDGITSSCNYWTVRFDLATGKRIEQERRLTNWAGFCVYGVSASADSKRMTFLEVRPGNFASYIADVRNGGRILANSRRFLLEGGESFIFDWSSDSNSVVVAGNFGDHYALFKQKLDSDQAESIASAVKGAVLTEAAWSPNQKWILALEYPVPGGPTETNQSAPYWITRIPSSGGDPVHLFPVVRPSPFSCARPPATFCVVAEQTEDQKQMVVTAFDPERGRLREIAKFDLDRPINLWRDNLICSLSPDGQHLAIARKPEGALEIHSLNGKLEKVIERRDSSRLWLVTWAPGGDGFFVTRFTTEGSQFSFMDRMGNMTSLRKCSSGACGGVASPDGKRLAYSDPIPDNNIWMMENF